SARSSSLSRPFSPSSEEVVEHRELPWHDSQVKSELLELTLRALAAGHSKINNEKTSTASERKCSPGHRDRLHIRGSNLRQQGSCLLTPDPNSSINTSGDDHAPPVGALTHRHGRHRASVAFELLTQRTPDHPNGRHCASVALEGLTQRCPFCEVPNP